MYYLPNFLDPLKPFEPSTKRLPQPEPFFCIASLTAVLQHFPRTKRYEIRLHPLMPSDKIAVHDVENWIAVCPEVWPQIEIILRNGGARFEKSKDLPAKTYVCLSPNLLRDAALK